MNKASFIKLLSRLLFIVSVIIIAFSIYKIYTDKIQMRKSVEEWNSIDEGIIKNAKGSKKPEVKTEDKKPNIQINVMGKMIIEKSKTEIPIIDGTTLRDLSRGAGHYTPSVYPGENGNSIFFGHRETAFKELKSVELNDIISIEVKKGTFKYRITEIKIVDPGDEFIERKADREVITLVTCYPFNLVGSAPKRFVVKGEMISPN